MISREKFDEIYDKADDVYYDCLKCGEDVRTKNIKEAGHEKSV